MLIRKSRSFAEIYNDIDGDVVNLFAVLREQPDDLVQALTRTPFARAEFDQSYEPADDRVEQARRTVVRSFMGHSSASTTKRHRTGFRAKSFGSHRHAANDWIGLPSALVLVAARFRGVVIENREASDVMRQFDAADTLHYLDPPYLLGGRHTNARWHNECYAREMTDDDHRELARLAHGLEGPVIVSGYPSDLYDLEFYPDWERVTMGTQASGAAGGVPRTEALWLSPRCVRMQRQQQLFDEEDEGV